MLREGLSYQVLIVREQDDMDKLKKRGFPSLASLRQACQPAVTLPPRMTALCTPETAAEFKEKFLHFLSTRCSAEVVSREWVVGNIYCKCATTAAGNGCVCSYLPSPPRRMPALAVTCGPGVGAQ